MRKFISYPVSENFQRNLIHFIKNYSRACILKSNSKGSNELIAAIGCLDEITPVGNCFEALKNFYTQKQDWLFGFISYEASPPTHPSPNGGRREEGDPVGFPLLHFFQPEFVLIAEGGRVKIGYLPGSSGEERAQILLADIENCKHSIGSHLSSVTLQKRISKKEYLETISKIKQHIQRGDIYEMNYCMEFFSEDAEIDPATVFLKLNETSLSPFSAFYRLDNRYLLCASPERFLKKEGRKIISQPIKGTAPRGKTPEEDLLLKEKLGHSAKDQSENVMIADLVRNDLSRTCENVRAEELFGIYTFRQWHQMISTISGEMKAGVHFTDVIENAFPMGSMTGAPKLSAMKLIERYEKTPRGLYSGAVGYLTPFPLSFSPSRNALAEQGRRGVMGEAGGEADFDFNVVIRSILYNSDTKYLSFSAGSAITSNSIPEDEYEECMVKAKGMFDALGAENPKSERTNSKKNQTSLV